MNAARAIRHDPRVEVPSAAFSAAGSADAPVSAGSIERHWPILSIDPSAAADGGRRRQTGEGGRTAGRIGADGGRIGQAGGYARRPPGAHREAGERSRQYSDGHLSATYRRACESSTTIHDERILSGPAPVTARATRRARGPDEGDIRQWRTDARRSAGRSHRLGRSRSFAGWPLPSGYGSGS